MNQPRSGTCLSIPIPLARSQLSLIERKAGDSSLAVCQEEEETNVGEQLAISETILTYPSLLPELNDLTDFQKLSFLTITLMALKHGISSLK